MTKKIVEQVERAFPKDGKAEYVNEYLAALRTNMHNTEDRFRNSTLLIFFMVAAFELLSQAAISEASFGPFKVSNLSLIQKVLPLIIAYIYYELMSLLCMRRLLMEAHARTIEQIYNPIFTNNLERYLHPSSAFTTADIISKARKGAIGNLMALLDLPLMVALSVAPLIYETYAFFRCFTVFGWTDILVWIISFLSILFLLQGYLMLNLIRELI